MSVPDLAHLLRRGHAGRAGAQRRLEAAADRPAAASRRAVRTLCALLLAMGVTVMSGWVLQVAVLTQVFPGAPSMVFNTALGFTLLALALLQLADSEQPQRLAAHLATVLVLGLALVNLAQILSGQALGINLPELHQWLPDGHSTPGQMALPTTIEFLLACSSLLLLNTRAPGRRWPLALARALSALVVVIGLLALVGYLLRLAPLYTWYAFSRMALHTAGGFVLLGTALWLLLDQRLVSDARNEATRILHLCAWTLITVALVTGLAAGFMLRDETDRQLDQTVQRDLEARARLIETALELRTARAASWAASEPVQRLASLLLSTRTASRAQPQPLLSQELQAPAFSTLRLLAPDGRELLGRSLAPPSTVEATLELATAMPGQAQLLWRGGPVLRHRLRLDASGVTVETEQDLHELTAALTGLGSVGSTAVAELCGLSSSIGLLCLPNRIHLHPYRPLALPGGQAPAQRAQRGTPGLMRYEDPQQGLVAAAFQPLGTTGLVGTSRLQVAQFYAPLRQRLSWGALATLLVMLAGVWSLHRGVRPLLQRLSRAEQRHRLVLDHLQEGTLLLDADGRILAANPAAGLLLGAPAADLHGQRLRDGGRQVIQSTGHTWPEEDCPIRRTLSSGTSQTEVVLGLIDAEGRLRWLQLSTARTTALEQDPRPGLVAVLQDITARRLAAEQIEDLDRRFQLMVEGVIDYAMYMVDLSGRVTSWNRGAQRLKGYEAPEILGQHLSRFYTEADVQAGTPEHELAHATANGHATAEGWHRRKDGSRFWGHRVFTAIRNPDGGLVGFSAVTRDLSERRRREQELLHRSQHDGLTGLPTRDLMHARLRRAMQRARRDRRKVGLLLIDLDHFKRINDSLGHSAGDRLLEIVAERLRAALRPTDTVSRMGGDEFVVILAGREGRAQVAETAAQLVTELSRPMTLDRQALHVTPSIGVTVFPDDDEDPTALLRHADAAMYAAKAAGRACHRLFSRDLQHSAESRLRLELALRRAVVGEQLHLLYQPQVCLVSGRVVGMEALLRWTDPELGVISPEQFIPIAEETGLIVPLGDWVLRTACRDAMRMRARTACPLRLAVNLSPRQFRSPELVESIGAALQDSELDAGDLELEVTEGVLMERSIEAAQRLEQIRALGVSIAIDDFGTGYSSLSYITRFAIDTLKIDRSFVSHLPHSSGDAAVALTIIALARNLGIRVVAEGVETQAQLDYLRQHRCDAAQGHLIADALAPEAFSVQGFLLATPSTAEAFIDGYEDLCRSSSAQMLAGAA